jgi:hypothetical protein
MGSGCANLPGDRLVNGEAKGFLDCSYRIVRQDRASEAATEKSQHAI